MGLESPPEFFTLKPYEKQEKDHYTLISGFRRYNTDSKRKVLKFSCISLAFRDLRIMTQMIRAKSFHGTQLITTTADPPIPHVFPLAEENHLSKISD